MYLLLDVGALVVLGAGAVFGRVLGTGFGSITLSAVGILLPLAGLGALTEWLGGREVSDAMGLLGLLALGVGFSLAAPARSARFERGLVAALAIGALLVGTNLAAESRTATSAALVVLPYWSAALLSCVMRPLRRRPAADRPEDAR